MGVKNSSILAILKPLTPKIDPIPYPPKIKKILTVLFERLTPVPPTLHETGLIKFEPKNRTYLKRSQEYVESFAEFQELF